MKVGESFGPNSNVDYEGHPNGIAVHFPTWYGHINYTFWLWNGQWYNEKAEHHFGCGKVD